MQVFISMDCNSVASRGNQQLGQIQNRTAPRKQQNKLLPPRDSHRDMISTLSFQRL